MKANVNVVRALLFLIQLNSNFMTVRNMKRAAAQWDTSRGQRGWGARYCATNSALQSCQKVLIGLLRLVFNPDWLIDRATKTEESLNLERRLSNKLYQIVTNTLLSSGIATIHRYTFLLCNFEVPFYVSGTCILQSISFNFYCPNAKCSWTEHILNGYKALSGWQYCSIYCFE